MTFWVGHVAAKLQWLYHSNPSPHWLQGCLCLALLAVILWGSRRISYNYYSVLILEISVSFFQYCPISFRLFLYAFMSQSDRMWNSADRVEDSPWMGKEGGPDSKSGLQWEGRGRVPVCLHYVMAAAVEIWMGLGRARSSGVIHFCHHIHSC